MLQNKNMHKDKCPQGPLFHNQFEQMEERLTRIEERNERAFTDMKKNDEEIMKLLNQSILEQKVFNENVVLKQDLKDTLKIRDESNSKNFFSKDRWNLIISLGIVALIGMMSILIMLINKIYGTSLTF